MKFERKKRREGQWDLEDLAEAVVDVDGQGGRRVLLQGALVATRGDHVLDRLLGDDGHREEQGRVRWNGKRIGIFGNDKGQRKVERGGGADKGKNLYFVYLDFQEVNLEGAEGGAGLGGAGSHFPPRIEFLKITFNKMF